MAQHAHALICGYLASLVHAEWLVDTVSQIAMLHYALDEALDDLTQQVT